MSTWKHLNRLQLGKYGEYVAKMECTVAGFDVYTAEVDDKGIDFVIRKNENEYFDVQVKSQYKSSYTYLRKDKFSPRKNLLVCLVIFKDDMPHITLLIPSLDWLKRDRHPFLTENDFQGRKSKAEWQIKILRNTKGCDLFYEHYSFQNAIKNL